MTTDERGETGDRDHGGNRDAPGDGDDGAAGVRTPEGRPCPHCGAAMYRRHCKYVCPGHGVVFDCSDPFYG